MTAYKLPRIAELAHQLRLSPARLRLQQLIGIDHLLDLVEPEQFYPYSWVCWHITGYRAPIGQLDPANLRGAALVHDLVLLAEELSRQNPVPQAGSPWPLWPIKELSDRLSVSPKTISRWREQRGLAIWWTVLPGGELRVAVPEKALRRFILANRQIVVRCRKFSQLTDEQRAHVLERARQLRTAGCDSIHSICRTVAREMQRSPETIRYILRQREQHWNGPATSGDNSAAADRRQAAPGEHQIIYKCWKSGDDIEALARRFGKTVRTIRRIILHQRRRRLLARRNDFVYSPEFDLPDAEARLLADAGDQERPSRIREVLGRPDDTPGPAYLLSAGSADPVPASREQTLFRRYNYCKFRLAQIVRQLQAACDGRRIVEAEQWVGRIEAIRSRLVEVNLRLVISVAKRHLQPGVGMDELVSEGNVVLMRAIEKFDYTRGFKFSTYASWSLMRHFARIIPQWLDSRRMQQTGCDEFLKLASTNEEVSSGLDRQLLGGLVQQLLGRLPKRERKVIEWHYGLLEDLPARSLSQIAEEMGISRERVRQIEIRGLDRLRTLLTQRESARAIHD